MGAYVKISFSSQLAGNYNSALSQSFIYIGKKYGKLANVPGLDDRRYLREGIAYIARKLGKYRKSAVNNMIYPKKIKNSINKQWCFHKGTYAKAYSLILDHLLKSPPSDMRYVRQLLIALYRGDSGGGKKMCSDALIYLQKIMLSLNRNHVTNGANSGIILRDVLKYDKPIP